MKNQTSLLTITTAVLLSGCFFNKNEPDILMKNLKNINKNTDKDIKNGKIVNENEKNNTEQNKDNNKQDNSNVETDKDNQINTNKENNIDNETDKENEKLSTLEKLVKLPKNTEFIYNDRNFFSFKENNKGKLEYKFQDTDTNKIFSFTLDEFEKDKDLYKSKFKTEEFKRYVDSDYPKTILSVRLKMPYMSYLDYGHYGIIEKTSAYQRTDQYGRLKEDISYSHIPFFVGEKDKVTSFKKLDKDIKFSGLTDAVLTTSYNKEIYDLIGTAEMEIKANKTEGDIIFKYNNWNKVITAKGVDLSDIQTPEKWEVVGLNTKGCDYGYLKGKLFNNKEFIGTYKVSMTEREDTSQNEYGESSNAGKRFYVVGGFGMKKQ